MRTIQNKKFKIHNATRMGFTAIEILIVVAILGVLMSVTVPSISDFRRNSQMNVSVANVTTLINKARLLSISGKNDTQYGVHLEEGKIVLFQGATYSAGVPTNEEYVFDSGLTLSSIIINGGGSDILFDRWTGGTSSNATTTISVSGSSLSSTIVIRPTGIVTPN